MSNTLKRFNTELEYLKDQNDELIIEAFVPEIRKIIETFSTQGHSGGSAPYYIHAITDTIKKALSQEALSPITGFDNEWVDVSESDDQQMFQNKRESAVFKDGRFDTAYYIDAIVFQGEDEFDTFTGTVENISSTQKITFPFTPKTFYIDVYKEPYDETKHGPNARYIENINNERHVYMIKDRSQLKELRKYYNTKF